MSAYDPAADLREPEIAQVIDPAKLTEPVTAAAQLDVGGVIVWILDQLDLNPGTWVAEFLAGDWEQFERAGTALGHLADYVRDEAERVDGGRGTMHTRWTGHAADAADSYFAALSASIGSVESQLRDLGQQIGQCAEGLRAFIDLITQGVDEVMKMMINAVASAWFPPLAVYRGIAAAQRLIKVLGLINEFLSRCTTFADALAIGRGHVLDQLAQLSSVTLAAPYTNPAYTPRPMSGSEQ